MFGGGDFCSSSWIVHAPHLLLNFRSFYCCWFQNRAHRARVNHLLWETVEPQSDIKLNCQSFPRRVNSLMENSHSGLYSTPVPQPHHPPHGISNGHTLPLCSGLCSQWQGCCYPVEPFSSFNRKWSWCTSSRVGYSWSNYLLYQSKIC